MREIQLGYVGGNGDHCSLTQLNVDLSKAKQKLQFHPHPVKYSLAGNTVGMVVCGGVCVRVYMHGGVHAHE